MTNRTFLSHRKAGCNGPVVIDMSNAAKLYAPSFAIDIGGIKNVTLDIQIMNSTKTEPTYYCIKCGETVLTDDIGKDLSAVCQVCGKTKPVDSIRVHELIVAICNSCEKEINDDLSETSEGDSNIKNFVEVFSLRKRINTVPMVSVLKNPIRI